MFCVRKIGILILDFSGYMGPPTNPPMLDPPSSLAGRQGDRRPTVLRTAVVATLLRSLRSPNMRPTRLTILLSLLHISIPDTPISSMENTTSSISRDHQ